MLATGMDEIMTRLGVPHRVTHLGPLLARLMLTHDQDDELTNYRDVRCGWHCDSRRLHRSKFQHHSACCRSVYFHPNQFEPMFLSTAHTPADIATVLDRMEDGARKCLVR